MLVLNYPITPTSKELVYSSQSKLSIIRGVWSPNGKKFAIGSSCKKLFVARYDPFLKMWVTVWLRVKEDVAFKSTVNTVRFHCSGRVVAAGSTDFTLKVVTAFLDTKNPDPNAEQMPLVEDYDYKGPFEKVTSMGEVLLNISNVQGWINDIAFGLKSEDLLVALHSNQLFVKKLSEAENKNEPDSFILWKGLPFNSLLPLNADTILAAGFDNRVGVFKRKGTAIGVM
jgi:actin related protein 2/3 complex subunit 1A/1B